LENTGDAKKIQENFGKSRRIPYIYRNLENTGES